HGFHQVGRAVVANLELALDRRDGYAATLSHERNSFVVQRIPFAVPFTARTTPSHAGDALALTATEHLFDVVRLTPRFPGGNDPTDLIVGPNGPVDPDR